MNEQPRWMQTLMRKHRQQIDRHELKYGKLGELQTPEQKDVLKQDVGPLRGKGRV